VVAFNAPFYFWPLKLICLTGRGQSATVIDVKSGKPVATIPFPGKPEFATADPKAGRVYSNIEDKNGLVAIDTITLTNFDWVATSSFWSSLIRRKSRL